MQSIRAIHRSRLLEEPVQGDALQETFINTVPGRFIISTIFLFDFTTHLCWLKISKLAWINMLLLSSAGPIRTPVGACATAVESVELGVEAIELGKAKVCVVGGYDDFGEEVSCRTLLSRFASHRLALGFV